jgi:hypothetical protein
MRKLRIVLLAGISAAAWSQAIVEYGLGVAAAGTAGANAGRGVGGIFSNLSKTLNTVTQAQTGATSSSTQPAKAVAAKTKAGTAQPAVSAAPAGPAKPAVVYEDPARITTGIDQAELLSRFGEPAVQVTGSESESLTYQAKDRSVEVEMRGGKVYSVQIKNKPRQSTVVVLQ